uniref:Transmembrane 9 superfamily member n=1 Tax=Paramoeba aestuarina TaxID=180227 RepID=A0A7S4KMM7_9EUKA|mmetsp:Transcript_21785/g.33854  ORF Transcript_21785/g.33854 Transcript_21785/m.33854 type:complete len:231 (+) Transcript_21785:97-789(+)|eukprot:CAMPEP_0201537318 /NCGR_PEP_ID=MMETSP0161_2-20130828/64411_1 /ASSEMBLY_ACC=CAM_ASM_000251 /TAXON_ID=180227 /ORGANISM="Neoparamoeba aestuarina, Strain SoJaBio B1-5/56/2" /LENGTH=230 /DNA_ID=CAMNT_0047943539 /DNA_START=100 /DNA_END=792 /DNA_ORIENTATION=+
MNPFFFFLLFLPFFPIITADSPSITFLGVKQDLTTFSSFGQKGFWVPGFNCQMYEYEKETNYSEVDKLEPWTGPLVHILRYQILEYPNHTFSMDGPCSVICGDDSFADVVLPDGEKGKSGILYDPAADENSNNSVNRVMLNDGVPESFILSIVVDNSNQMYDSVNKIDARGEHDKKSIEPDVVPEPGEGAFNGIPDLYQFRYDNFSPNDYIKIRFNGGETGASFGGMLFD